MNILTNEVSSFKGLLKNRSKRTNSKTIKDSLNVYRYFSPLKVWIRNNDILIGNILENILSLKKGSIRVIRKQTPLDSYLDLDILNNRIGIDVFFGNKESLYKIEFSLCRREKVECYVKNGKNSVLLETMLYPQFLPGNSEVVTIINVKNDRQKFIVGENSNCGRVGISTVL